VGEEDVNGMRVWGWKDKGDEPSDSRLESGTEPVSSTVRIPSVISVKPSVREK
jgi:hypothetical protein